MWAEVIEAGAKPRRPWGSRAQTAHGDLPDPASYGPAGTAPPALLALGRQDVEPDGLAPGDEIAFGLGYSALVRAMTSPFVDQVTLG